MPSEIHGCNVCSLLAFLHLDLLGPVRRDANSAHLFILFTPTPREKQNGLFREKMDSARGLSRPSPARPCKKTRRVCCAHRCLLCPVCPAKLVAVHTAASCAWCAQHTLQRGWMPRKFVGCAVHTAASCA